MQTRQPLAVPPPRFEGEGVDLNPVILLRFFLAHQVRRVIAVSPRPDAPTDHHSRSVTLEVGANLFQQLDDLVIGLGECIAGVTELLTPIGAGAPGGAFQDETDPVIPGDGCCSAYAVLMLSSLRMSKGELRGSSRAALGAAPWVDHAARTSPTRLRVAGAGFFFVNGTNIGTRRL